MLESAIQEFEKKTFEGIKDGLEDIGRIVEAIPSLAHDCRISDDLSKFY